MSREKNGRDLTGESKGGELAKGDGKSSFVAAPQTFPSTAEDSRIREKSRRVTVGS